MNTLSIILIIIIFLSILYLYLKNRTYNKTLEHFQQTQDSLSVYYQDNKNHVYKNSNIHNNDWSGLWTDQHDTNLNAQFLQNNDKLLIGFSNISFNLAVLEENIDSSCPDNTFLGVGQLNHDNTSFYLIKVICNNYQNSNMNLTVNNFSGTISSDNKTITLYSNGIASIYVLSRYHKYVSKKNSISNSKNIHTINNATIDLCKDMCNAHNLCNGFSFDNIQQKCYLKNDMSNLSNNNDYTTYIKVENPKKDNDMYLNSISPFANTYPKIPESNYDYKENYCPTGSQPCYSKDIGLSDVSFNNMKYNACGIPVSNTDNTCMTTTCSLNPNYSSDVIKTCEKKTEIFDYMNHYTFSELSQTHGDSLSICDFLNVTKYCNSFIFCYVSNIGNVLSLNYQFFGSQQDESSLILQNDVMNNYLNNSNYKMCILPTYRDIITNNQNYNQENVLGALSFTNCLENSHGHRVDTKIKTSLSCAKKYVNNYNNTNINNQNLPTVWSINSDIKKNVVTSCSITLSTSKKYKTQPKYVTYNHDGTTSMSLFGGGLNQQLIMENVKIIQKNIQFDNYYTAFTANLRTNNKSYLVPSVKSGFGNNSNVVELKKHYQENAKWLVIGFNLDNINNLNTVLQNITFNIINNPELS